MAARVRYNEVMAFVIALYGWGVFALDPQMRADIWAFLLADKAESRLTGIIVDVLAWAWVLGVGMTAAEQVVRPFTRTVNVRDERESVLVLIVSANVVSGGLVAWHLATTGSEPWHYALAAGNAAFVAWEIFGSPPHEQQVDEVDAGETVPIHALVATIFTAALFALVQLREAPYWAESVSIACVAAGAFGLALPWALPLAKTGWRATRADE